MGDSSETLLVVPLRQTDTTSFDLAAIAQVTQSASRWEANGRPATAWAEVRTSAQ